MISPKHYLNLPLVQAKTIPVKAYFAPDQSGLVCVKVDHSFMHPLVAICIGLSENDTLGMTPAGNFYAINDYSWVYEVTDSEYEGFRLNCVAKGTL